MFGNMSSLVTLLLFVHASIAKITPEEYLGALKALKMDQDQMKVKIAFLEAKNVENTAEINHLKAKNADQDLELFKLKTMIDDQLVTKHVQSTTVSTVKSEPKKSLLVNLLSDLQIKITENKTTNQPYEKRNTGNESKVEDKDKKTDVQAKLEFTNQYEKATTEKLEKEKSTKNGEKIEEPTTIKPIHQIDSVMNRNETSDAGPSFNVTVNAV